MPNNNETKPTTREDREFQSTKPPVEMGLMEWRFTYRGRPYGAEAATKNDIVEILQGVRGEVEEQEDKEAEELSVEARQVKTNEEAIKIGNEAGLVNRNSKNTLDAKYQRLENFFTNLTGEGVAMAGGRPRRLFKLKEGASQELFRLNQPTVQNAEVAKVGDNKTQVLEKNCFILDARDANQLKEMLKKLGSDRFKIVEGSETEDTFLVYMDGKIVPFLCPAEKDYELLQQNKEEKEEAGNENNVISLDKARTNKNKSSSGQTNENNQNAMAA